jgi:hypothetical protein
MIILLYEEKMRLEKKELWFLKEIE